MRRALAVLVSCAVAPSLVWSQSHDHATAGHHAGKPVECRTLAAPPWSGLPASDLAYIRTLQSSVASVRATDAAARAGFGPLLGDVPTMGVHWVNRSRMEDGVQLNAPDHLLFTRIAGRDSLVGVAYAFRGPLDAKIPQTFASDLAMWHDHAELGGGPGQTLHMLHVWFVPSPYGPFAGNNFFLPFMGAGMALPSSCWLESDADVERLEMVASLVDIVNRQRDTAMVTSGRVLGARGRQPMVSAMLRAFVTRVSPTLAALDSAAARGDRAAWERAADQAVAGLQPIERQLITAVRDRVKGAQASMRSPR